MCLYLRIQIVHKIYSGVLGTYYFVNFIRMTIASTSIYLSGRSSKPLDKIREIFAVGPALIIFFLYIFLNYNSKKFGQLIFSLMRLSSSVSPRNALNLCNNTTFDIWKRFPKFCLIVLVLALLNSFSESIAYNSTKFNCTFPSSLANPDSFAWFGENWKCYNDQSIYKSLLAVILFICGKFLLFVWAFSDILAIVFCQAMKYMLLIYNVDIKQLHLQCSRSTNILIDDRWNQTRQRYQEIMCLFEKITIFLCPLILSCYGINLYLVIDNVIHL